MEVKLTKDDAVKVLSNKDLIEQLIADGWVKENEESPRRGRKAKEEE